MTPLHVALSRGHTACAEALSSAGCDVNVVKCCHCGDGVTPLHVAAQHGNITAVRALLAARADARAAANMNSCEMGPLYNCSGVTPLHLAVAAIAQTDGEDRPAVVRALAEAGADVTAQLDPDKPDGQSVVALAAEVESEIKAAREAWEGQELAVSKANKRARIAAAVLEEVKVLAGPAAAAGSAAAGGCPAAAGECPGDAEGCPTTAGGA